MHLVISHLILVSDNDNQLWDLLLLYLHTYVLASEHLIGLQYNYKHYKRRSTLYFRHCPPSEQEQISPVSKSSFQLKISRAFAREWIVHNGIPSKQALQIYLFITLPFPLSPEVLLSPLKVSLIRPAPLCAPSTSSSWGS